MIKAHRNLLWLRAAPELLDELLADKSLARLVLARPAPELCAVRRADHQRLVARLNRLGHTPRERGQW